MSRRPTFTYCKPFADKNWGVVVENGTPEQMVALRSSVTDNWIESPHYKAHRKSHAFLQSYDEKGGWCFIEFWSPQEHHGDSVALLKAAFKEAVSFSRNRPKYKRRRVYEVFGEIPIDRKVRTLRQVRQIVREALMDDQRVYVDRVTKTTSTHETTRIYRHSSGYELDTIHPFGHNAFPHKGHRYYAKRK